ncbi:hypothetical protein C3747_46g171 [Trypanosoma cruzi]|uniref:Uncharacterized protein n=2 Tax=Trypanosoma cruzi TaxID=5693 RepID=Q4CZC6_TRYCC|nr:hypothetical protein Tc00.1047053508681.31 [Trypanosoma cruzi]EAN85629.1 hypothetical protein Tc00.1047053508681.31 [Trypanosoma cruzi]KAF8304335.1 hypothetical protein TcYC6_0036780 [Trypanosoma cruzi]PWV13058.1 hypothetical protein C3747_46g171 [Trypanosoma cruzi]|eukprot:XP_807480.1 hypothetical protein [Trypanosoma cruzi strain CL Brener]
MSTVLYHLVTHIVDVPFCLARSAEERVYGCSLSLATAACPRTKLVMRNSDKASDLAQLIDKWSAGIVALAERIIGARQLKPGAHRFTVTGDWEPTCTDSILTRGEEAALACLRSGVSHKYGWLPRPLQPAIPSTFCWCGPDASQQARKRVHTETPPPPAGPHHATIRRPADCPVCGKHRSCRTSVVTHMVNAQGITRSPSRCGSSAFPVSRNRQKSHRNHRPALERGREREKAHRSHLRRRLHRPGRSHSHAVSAWRRAKGKPELYFIFSTSTSKSSPDK